MMRWVMMAVVLVCCAGGVSAQSAAGAGQAAAGQGGGALSAPSFAAAEELAGHGRLDQAMAMLDQLAGQRPEPAGVERLRGIIFYQREQFGQAVEAFARATAGDGKDRESMELQGVSLFRMGRPAEAIPLLEKARTAVQRANIDPEYVLGLCYAEVGRYDDARHAFAVQYGFAGDSPEAYVLAGRLFLRREMRDQAGAQANKALELNAAMPLAHELLGEVALARGDVPGAIRELEAERKINPLDPDLYDRLGDAYLRMEQYPQAQQALNRAVLLEPGSTGPYILLGQTFLKLNQPIQALQYLDRAVKMDPSNYITHNLLGQAYKALGQVAEANRQFKMGVDLQHGSGPKAAESR